MSVRRKPTVVDIDGVRAHIREFVVDDAGTAAVVIRLASGAQVTLPMDVLRPHEDGGYAIPARWHYFVAKAPEHVEVPVVAEEVTVGVRARATEEVHVRRRVVAQEQVVETPLWHERIEVEHVPSGAFVDEMPRPRQDGDVLVVPCVEEVVVTRLRIREELRIRVVREQRVDRQTVTVRRHEVDIHHSNPSSKKH